MNDETGSELDSTTSWIIAALGLVVLVLVWGTIFTFTVYSQALADAFNLSSLQASSVFSITTAAFYVAGGVIGVLVARLPLRPVVAAAGVGLAAAVGLVQVVSSYVGLVFAFGLLGVAAGTMFVVVLSLVPQWFDAYEGRAMGITLTGNGLGILVLPPVWTRLLDWGGFRGALAVVGGILAAVVLSASLVYRRPAVSRTADTTPGDLAWLRSKLVDRRFQAALVGFALVWSWYFALSSHLVSILSGQGVARTVATAAFGAIGGASVVARVASGEFADRIGMRTTLTGGVALTALGLFALPAATGRPTVYATVLVFGVGLGALATLYSPIIIRRFGPENATAIVGLFTLTEAATSFLVPVALDVLVTTLGGYTVPLIALGVVTLVAAGLFYWGTAPSGAENVSR